MPDNDTASKPNIPAITLAVAYQRLKAVNKEALKAMSINPQFCNLDALISPVQLRNALIRQEYRSFRKKGVHHKEAYNILFHKYQCSYSAMIDIIKGKV